MNHMEAQQVLRTPETEVVSTHPSATMLDRAEGTPYTLVKVTSEGISDKPKARQVDIPRRVQRMKEASQEDALASALCFFALENGQSQVVSLGLPEEVPITTTGGITSETSTPAIISTIPNTSTTTTTTGAGTGSPRTFFQMGHLLGQLQQLLVDHRHGCREFWKNGLMFLPQKVLNQERVVYMNLPY